MLELIYDGVYYSTYDEDRIYNDTITTEGDVDWDTDMKWCRNIAVIRYSSIKMKDLVVFGVDLEGDDERDILRELGIIVFNGKVYKYRDDFLYPCFVPEMDELAYMALIVYRMIRYNLGDDFVFVRGDGYYELSASDIEYLAYIDEKYSKKFGFNGTIKIDTGIAYDMTGNRKCSVDGHIMCLCDVKDYTLKNSSAYEEVTLEHFSEQEATETALEMKEKEQKIEIRKNFEDVKWYSRVVYLNNIMELDATKYIDVVSNINDDYKAYKYSEKRIERLNEILMDCFITYGCKVTDNGLQLVDKPDIEISQRALELFDMLCRDSKVLVFDCNREDMDDSGINTGVLGCLYSLAFDFEKIFIIGDDERVFGGLLDENNKNILCLELR